VTYSNFSGRMRRLATLCTRDWRQRRLRRPSAQFRAAMYCDCIRWLRIGPLIFNGPIWDEGSMNAAPLHSQACKPDHAICL
jgi:hypothetical protein